jgi:hypothetical protein
VGEHAEGRPHQVLLVGLGRRRRPGGQEELPAVGRDVCVEHMHAMDGGLFGNRGAQRDERLDHAIRAALAQHRVDAGELDERRRDRAVLTGAIDAEQLPTILRQGAQHRRIRPVAQLRLRIVDRARAALQQVPGSIGGHQPAVELVRGSR